MVDPNRAHAMRREVRAVLAAFAAACLLGAWAPPAAPAAAAAPEATFPAGWYRMTAYCESGSLTASGTVPHMGTVAAAPSVPFGTALLIEGVDGLEGQTFVVEDRGAAITDGHLDIWLPSCWQAVQFGRRWLWVQAADASLVADAAETWDDTDMGEVMEAAG